MECPHCRRTESKVIDSRPIKGGIAIRRRRECLACEGRWLSRKRFLIGYKITQFDQPPIKSQIPLPTAPSYPNDFLFYQSSKVLKRPRSHPYSEKIPLKFKLIGPENRLTSADQDVIVGNNIASTFHRNLGRGERCTSTGSLGG